MSENIQPLPNSSMMATPYTNAPRAVTDSSASGIINGITLRRIHFIGGARGDPWRSTDRWIHFVLGSGRIGCPFHHSFS